MILTSKARVAPLKPTSMPNVCTTPCTGDETSEEALENQVSIDFTYYWLDSMTALYWIKNTGEWNQFVSHRVKEILKLTRREEWRHCPGRERESRRYRFQG